MNRVSPNSSLECWGLFEIKLPGPADGNPFADVEIAATFRHERAEAKVRGFYAGDGEYRIRFMPDRPGPWTYETSSDREALNGHRGAFVCTPPAAGNRGPVRTEEGGRFVYGDGTPFLPFGTTAYAWMHQSEPLRDATLRTLSAAPFNKIRMCVFPKHYPFNAEEPALFPFEGSPEDGFDVSRFHMPFWEHAEHCMEALLTLGVEADLILFHPYDKGRWGFDRMEPEADARYLRYTIARFGAYRNVWWSMANEYDFMKEKRLEDWDRLIRIAAEEDPSGRPLSIHNGTTMYVPESVVFYDHAHPRITHCSIQHWDVTLVTSWRRAYGKPVIVDECGYEGNLPQRWGNLTAEEMAHRCWESFARGGYAAHGETYLHEEDEIWWAKGGSLYGKSHEYIRFLRDVAEDAPAGLAPIPVRDVPAIGKEGEYYLHYYGQHRPAYREVELPEDEEFAAEWIDTRGMSIVRLEETFRGSSRVPLPGKPYYALRLRRKGAVVT